MQKGEEARMRLGISTASFYPELIESAVKRSAALGFRVLEVFVNSEVESGADFGKRTGDLAREYGMEIVAYHPYTSFAESFYFFFRIRPQDRRERRAV